MFQDYQGRLRDMLAQEGRDPKTFKTVLYYGMRRQSRARPGVSRSKSISRRLLSKGLYPAGCRIWTACGPVEHCIDCVRGFIEAGVDHVTIRPIGDDLDRQFQMFLEEVLPALNSAASDSA